MAELFVLPISEVEGLTSEYCKEHFPLRYEKALKYKYHEDYLRCVAAGELLVRAGIDEKEITLGEKGKPLTNGVYFNLSHSGDYAALALSDTEVGVDIEQVSRAHLSVAKKVLTEEELLWMGDDETKFCKLWTLKEAVIKCFGLGLSMPMKSFSVLELINSGRDTLCDTLIYSKTTKKENYFISYVYKEQP